MTVIIRLLGPPQIEKGGTTFTKLRTRKTMALLAYLVRQARPLPRTQLAGLFWGNSLEARARRSLTTDLSYLTKHFPGLIEADRHTICFEPTADYWVDTVAFDQLIKAGERLKVGAAIHPAVATFAETIPHTDRLTEAASLYRDAFMTGYHLDDCPDYESWLSTEQAHWQRLITNILAQLTTHYQQLEQNRHALIFARRWLALQPWQEEAHQQIIRLLMRQGKRSEALAQYETCCHVLQKDLGVLPGPETEVLGQQIKAFGMATGSASEVSKQPVALVDRSTPAPFQAEAPPPHFVGRTVELAQLQALLQPANDTAIIALVGMGGSGKTALAAYLAQQHRSQLTGGVLWANVATSDPLDILLSWGRAYGYELNNLTDLANRAATVRDILADKQVLIVLDNVEQTAQVRSLLPNGQANTILLSTRSLDVAHALHAESVLLADLTPKSGLQLLTAILGQPRIQAEIGAATEICQRLHYLPLALEIAAQRLKSRPRVRLETMAEQLQQAQHRLALEISDQAVRTSFAVSWETLNNRLQQLFASLSVFEGRPFRVAAVVAIAKLDLFTVEDHIYTLTALSLLQEDSDTHFRQHPLLADFAQEKLTKPDQVHQRMATFYLTFCQDNKQDKKLLESEWDNINAAIQAAYRQGNRKLVIAYTKTLADPWLKYARYSDARQAYSWAATLIETNDVLGQANNYYHWGTACIDQNDYAEGEQHLTQSLRLYQHLNQPQNLVLACYQLARIATERGHYHRAKDYLDRGLKIQPHLEGHQVALIYFGLARLYYDYGPDYEQAQALALQALALQTHVEDETDRVQTLRLLLQVAEKKRDYVTAEIYGKQCLDLCKKIGDPGELAATQYALLPVYRFQKALTEAQAMAENSLTLFRQMGNSRVEAMVLRQQGLISAEQEDYELALTLTQKSLAIFERIEDHLGCAYALSNLGDYHTYLGNQQQGQAVWQSAIQLAESLNHATLLTEIKGKQAISDE